MDWHTDQSYVTDPATGALLYMVEMPPDGGRTFWANLRLAYAALPKTTRRRIEGLSAVYDYLKRQSGYDDEEPMSDELRRKTPPLMHPLVNTHPITGVKSFYLEPTTTTGIAGLRDDDGRTLLDELNAHATDTIQGLAEIVAFQQSARRGAAFVERIRECHRQRIPFFSDLTIQTATLEVATGLGGLAVIIAGTRLVQGGDLDSSLLPLLTLLPMAAFLPVSEIANVGRQLAETLGRSNEWTLLRSDGDLYLTVGDLSVSCSVIPTPLVSS